MSPRGDRVVAGGLTALGCGSVALTTWIWLRTGSLAPVLRDPTTPNVAEAYLTGLLSSNLMVLQVVLLARVPWLERAWGRDVLVRRHRRLGTWSFWLMVVHVYLFALRAALQGPSGRGLRGVFLTDRWMLLATVGTALVVLVVVTSVRRAMAALRYETWHLLHLWAYVGMGLALPHQLVSADFAVGWVTAYWWTLYLVAVATVVVCRVGVPLWRSWRHDLRVADVRTEAPGVTTVEVTGRDLAGLGARAGDFLTWRFLGTRGRSRGHPYSLSAAPTGGRLRVTVRGGGDAGDRVGGLQVGARVLVEGPYGALPGVRRRHPRLLLVAAGVGVTPFRALLEALDLAPGEATLLHRVRSSDEALFRAELGDLAAGRDIEVVRLVGPRRREGSWLPTGVADEDDAAALTTLVPDLTDCDVMVSGPPEWAASVLRAAWAAGVRRRDVHLEHFGW